MFNNRPGFITTPGLIAGILTLLIIVVVGLTRGGLLFSPGALNAQAGPPLGGVKSHAEIGGECSTCHPTIGDEATMAEHCIVCHTDITAQMQNPASLHGTRFKAGPNVSCRDCHIDHRGAAASLTTLQNSQFAHEQTGYSIVAHQIRSDGAVFTCRDCHTNGYIQFDQAVCLACHQQIKADFMQPHLQTFGNNCLACHDGKDAYGHAFNHQKVAFELTGKHAPLPCEKCHQNARSLADLRATPTDCVSCHKKDNPHSYRLGTDCTSCHKAEGWAPATINHNLAVFKLEGKHFGVACESCHAHKVFSGTPTDCVSCHKKDDKHNERYGTDCAACHKVTGWLPANLDHNLFAFKLTGKHVTVACLDCHIDNIFQGTPSNCVDCHAKANPHSSLLGTHCGNCHTTDAWLPATFDHNLAAYKLTGKHILAACADCHINNVYRGAPSNCYACHQKNDHHNGQFGTNCGMCHATAGWLPARFDHNLFPGAVCSSCHSAPASHSGLGSNCSQCHTTSNWNFNHPGGCEGNCASHQHASCNDCHPSGYSTATCKKCHDNNNPGD